MLKRVSWAAAVNPEGVDGKGEDENGSVNKCLLCGKVISPSQTLMSFLFTISEVTASKSLHMLVLATTGIR